MDALINRIVELCHGDKAKAKYIIQGAMAYYPGQTALWYLQKVISDLEVRQAEAFRQKRGAIPLQSQPVQKPAQAKFNAQRYNHLLSLVKGDTGTASRLIQATRTRNLGKSDQWVLEKVIWDLERDRNRC